MIQIIDYFWASVCGTDEWKRVMWSMSTPIKATGMKNGVAVGNGTWGSQEIGWKIDFGANITKLDFHCDCKQMNNLEKNATAPCVHIIRALLQLEAKIKNKTFEDIHKDRLNQIIPF